MNIRIMQFIDKYAGFFACAAISLFKPLFKKAPAPKNIRIDKILIIKFWGFGSIILAFDFFKRLRSKYPQAYLCALTLKQNAQIFRMSGLFNEVLDIDVNGPCCLFAQLLRIVSLLRKNKFDISFDLEFTSRFSAVVSCLIGAKQRIGFKYEGIWRGNCYTQVIRFKEDAHLIQSLLAMAAACGIEEGGLVEKLKIISEQDGSQVEAILKKENLAADAKIISININASRLCLLRRWPKEYFIALADELINNYSVQAIFVGSDEDSAYVREALSAAPAVNRNYMRDFTGKLSLGELAYLIKRSKLFISNDSGPLHLANYLEVPTVSFFGPETPIIYGPQGKQDIIFYRDPGCSPCIRIKKYKSADCKNNQLCLKGIKPQEVLHEIRRKNLL